MIKRITTLISFNASRGQIVLVAVNIPDERAMKEYVRLTDYVTLGNYTYLRNLPRARGAKGAVGHQHEGPASQAPDGCV